MNELYYNYMIQDNIVIVTHLIIETVHRFQQRALFLKRFAHI